MRSIRNALCLTLALCISVVGLSIGSAGASALPKQALANVNVGVPTVSIQEMPIWVAQTDGYYAAKGLNVKMVSLSASTVTAALVSNSVQVLFDSASVFLAARATNTPIEAVEANTFGLPTGLIIGTAFAAAHNITLKTPLATVAKDMIGSVGGSSAVSTTGQIDLFLEEYGVQPSQVSIATLSNTTADTAALQKNEIDWFLTSEPVPYQVQALGYGIVVATPKNVAAFNPRKEDREQLNQY